MVIATAVFISSCGKKAPAYTRYIPKEASSVISIDTKGMMAKLEKDSLSVEKILEVLKADTANATAYATALETYKRFKESGIDWDSKVYINATSVNLMGYLGGTSIQVVAGMKDVSKFEAFVKQQPGSKEVKKGEGFSYMLDDEWSLGWNDDAVMLIAGGDRPSYEDFLPDSLKNSKPRSETNASGPAEKLKKYFKLEKKESILSVDGFNDLQGKQGDITIFNQVNLDGISAMAFAFLPKLKEMIDGSYSSSIINFENGKVVVNSDSHVSDKVADVLKKYAGPEVDLSLLENYPSQQVNGVMAFSFKPELIPALIRETGLDALLSLGLIQTGMGLDDFAKIFKGDFAVAVSDFAVVNKDMGKDANVYRSEEPTAKLVFTARIGDKAAFEKLINFAVKEGMIIRNGDMLIPADGGVPANDMPFAISTANNALTFASDSATLAVFQSKTQKIGLSEEVRSKLKGHSVAAYIDLASIFNGVLPIMHDSTNMTGHNIFSRLKTDLKNASFTMENFKGNSLKGSGELVFGDANKNSLSQLTRLIMYIYEQDREEKAIKAKQWAEQDKIEVTVVEEPKKPTPPPPPAKKPVQKKRR